MTDEYDMPAARPRQDAQGPMIGRKIEPNESDDAAQAVEGEGCCRREDRVYYPTIEHVLEGDGPIQSLNSEQDTRVAALYHARSVLEKRGAAAFSANSSHPPEAEDLLKVAEWIISGKPGGVPFRFTAVDVD